MREEKVSGRLREEMACLRVTPALRGRALDAMQGKERKPVKKKLTMVVVFALISVLLCGVALAAASRAGVLDFIGRYAGTFIPQDAGDYMQTDVAAFDQGATASAFVRELYYDGRTVRLTVDVTPSQEKTLLAGVDTWIEEDPWQDLISMTWDDMDLSDTRTVADVFKEQGYERAYNVNIYCGEEAEGRIVSGSEDCVLGEDGVLTVFCQWEFDSDQPQREITLAAALEEYEADASGAPMRTGEIERYAFPMTLTSASRQEGAQAEIYVSEGPVLFEEIGVRVDRVSIEVKPLELYATVDMTIVDEALYAKTDDGLWFEFIDPSVEAQEPWEQRLDSGLTGNSTSGQVEGAHYRQRETLGLNELRETYTLRAYECWNKMRFDTHAFTMRPATEEEIADVQRARELDEALEQQGEEAEEENG